MTYSEQCQNLGWSVLQKEKCLRVAEYASISLNVPRYTWKCLGKLFWICQGSEYAWSSCMFDWLLKMFLVLNMPGFWIWHDCICKGYMEFRILCLNIAQCVTIMPEYVSICLNVPQYIWTWLNIAECSWICLKMPEQNVLTMPGFSIALIILQIWQGFEYLRH